MSDVRGDMNDEAFVTAVMRTVVDKGVTSYREIFTDADAVATATDPYWISALRLYESLSEKDRNVLLQVMRQVTVDTVSHLFGILDGSSPLREGIGDFDLIHTESGAKLNGDLQDLFLGQVEGE